MVPVRCFCPFTRTISCVRVRNMVLVIVSILIVALAAYVGYRRGAVRAVFTQIGLLLGAMIAAPLGPLAAALLGIAGLKNLVLAMFAGPIVIYLLIILGAKFAGAKVQKKLDVYYKYEVPDVLRLAWERLNQRLGACVGVANGVLYILILCVLIYLPAYLTVQASHPEKEPIAVKALNQLGRDINATRMHVAVSPFLPVTPGYFDGADVLGLLFHNPSLEGRLGHYAGLAPVADAREVQDLKNDSGFRQAWAGQPAFLTFFNHPKAAAAMRNPKLVGDIVKVARADGHDLREYMITGQSLKYAEKLLGRWTFSLQGTLSRARKRANASTAEIARLRKALTSTMDKATFTALPDNTVVIRAPGGSSQGTWSQLAENKYALKLSESDKPVEAAAQVEGDRVVVTKDGLALVFEKYL
jgi:uncharacterized membrane protein required for colicin V production